MTAEYARGTRIRIIGGKYNGRFGTLITNNGVNSSVALHEPDEVALRTPSNMRGTATVCVVPKSKARMVPVVYVRIGHQIPVEDA